MTNPVLAFAARRRMRSWRTPTLLTLYSLMLMSIAFFVIYKPFLQPTIMLHAMRQSVTGYMIILFFQFLLLILVAPAMTAGSISGERERQTLDLLLVTNTGTGSLVFGKLLESFGFLALLVLCSMPTLSLVVITGGATIGQVMISVLFLLLVALAASSVGLFCSTLFNRTVMSTVVSYLSVFAIGILTLLPIWHDVKQIGDIYDSFIAANQVITTIDYTPISFAMNPGLGLFSLLNEQTGFNAGGYMNSISYTLATTFRYLPVGRFLAYNCVFMAGASMLLVALSAFKVRIKKAKKPKRSKAV